MDAVVLFEDDRWTAFKPLTWTRPVCLLRSGIFPLWKKVARLFPDATVVVHTRSYLTDVLTQRYRQDGLLFNQWNELEGKEILLVNGRLLVTPQLASKAKELEKEVAYVSGDDLIALWISSGHSPRALSALTKGEPLTADDLGALRELARSVRTVSDVPIVRYPWDLVNANAELIKEEFPIAVRDSASEGKMEPGAVLYGGDHSKLFLGKGSVVHPTVVLDVSHGPIYIGAGTIVYPPTRIEGPAYIGANTWIVGGKIREGSNIGDVCRVGGEVEESIILGYSNKYHDGFLGHAIVGEWVNLGALTTNSDLKDTYGSVRVDIEGEGRVNAGTKVGCFIGDHVKTSIGALIYTGKRLGIYSHLHGVATEDVPSFTIWTKSLGADGDKVELLLESAVEIHERVLSRRKVPTSDQDRELIRYLFEATRPEREKAEVRIGRPAI
ncbi:MAG: putative sugar nucleotidyl transferase [Armatimonadetes bacterium]|nr:putative sugar nucleotidyl transferase [Armatimonadota bacterium]MDW8121074.1 putative sugar nucleotidyl transferase [Armatimonadota bacterium]